MVSEDHLAAPAWTALLEQPPCCLRGCRARCPFGGWNQLAAAAMLGDSGWMNRSAYFCNLFYVYIYIYTLVYLDTDEFYITCFGTELPYGPLTVSLSQKKQQAPKHRGIFDLRNWRVSISWENRWFPVKIFPPIH